MGEVNGLDLVIENVFVDAQAPSVPTNVAASNILTTSFNLTWTASTDNVGVTGYEVFKNGVSAGTTTTNSMNVSGLTGATAYAITVKAKDAAGNLSAASTAINVTTATPIVDTQAPSVPAGLASSNITFGSFTLSWAASTDNVGVASYEVFKNGTSVGTTTFTTMNIAGLSPSTTYAMTVRAKDEANNTSNLSNALNVTTSAAPVTSSNNYIGINVGGPADFSEDKNWADAFRTARDFRKIGSDVYRSATLDSKGWPTEDAWTYLFANNRMNGTYKLRFTGVSNTLSVFGATIQNKVYNASTNTTTADLIVTDTNGSTVAIYFTGTNGGVKDVKCMRPISIGSSQSYSFDTEFSTPFLNLVKKFQCVRFLGWDATNGNICTSWADRVPDDCHWESLDKTGYGWEGRGGSWESMIRFCNTANVDAWINIPINADANYVTQLANLWKNNLNPNLKLYVEYSNEVWNFAGAFWTQFNSNRTAAYAEVEAGNSPLNFDNRPVTGDPNTEDYVFVQRRPGKRIVEISNIFRSVFGDDQMMTRVRPVLCWQQPTGLNSFDALDLIDKVYGTVNQWNSVAHPVNYYIYGGGGSAYYNPNNASDALSIDNIWTSETYDVNNWKEFLKKEADLCAAYGIVRVAYEGGPSMDNEGHSEAVKAQAINDPRMKSLTIEHQAAWNQYGGGLLNFLASTGDYQWGFTSDVTNLNTPKFQAVDQINASYKEAITYGYTIPATIDATNVSISGGTVHNGGSGNLGLRTGSNVYGNGWASYTLNVTTAGTYNIKFKVNSNWSYTGSVKMYCDGVYLGTETVNTPGQISASYTVTLAQGLHSVRFYNISNAEVSLAEIIIGTGAGTKSVKVSETPVVLDNQISIYPNPASDVLNISVSSSNNSRVGIQLFDLRGKMVLNTEEELTEGDNTLKLNVSYLTDGLYFIRVKNGEFNLTQKVIIRNK